MVVILGFYIWVKCDGSLVIVFWFKSCVDVMGNRIWWLLLEMRKVVCDDFVVKFFFVIYLIVDWSKMIDDDNNGFNCWIFFVSMGFKKDMIIYG